MRTLFVFLSIGLAFAFIQYSNGAPADYYPSESEEDGSTESKIMNKLQPVNDDDEDGDTTTQSKPVFIQVNENDQSSEEKQNVLQALQLTTKLEEVDNQNMKDDTDENEENVANIVNDDYQRVLRDDYDDD